MYRWMLGIIFLYPLVIFAEGSESASSGSAPSEATIPVLTINGAIGPAVSDYLIREIDSANSQGTAPIIILNIDTPGGLTSSLRDINQHILNSHIPLACLVYPQGARAASAGTYILYACHIAAMAPTTTLGAATPVMIGGPLFGDSQEPAEQTEPTAMDKKVLNDSIAYIRSLAQLRGRNIDWAEQAVIEAATLTAQEALEQNVINLIADSPEHLVARLDGYELKTGTAFSTFTINTTLVLKDVTLDYREPDWRSKFLATITDPNIAYILMLVGVYGLALEFYSGGSGVAGVIGGISLFVAVYAFQLLPVNYVGLGLIILGIGLMIAESVAPSFGVFGLGGVISFVLGSVFLFDSQDPQFKVSIALIMPIALVASLFSVYLLRSLWRMRHRKVVSGQESIVGSEVVVLDDFQDQGYVSFGGERWFARCTTRSTTPLTAGQTVVVQAVEGLTLIVSIHSSAGGIENGHISG